MKTMAKRDLYDVLSVERNSTPNQIKSAYRQLAKRFHPDRNPNDPEAERLFREAAEAYDVLSDPEKRARYDRYGFAGVENQGASDFRSPDDVIDAVREMFAGTGFGDLFGGGGRRRGPRQGADILYRIEIDLEEAARGATKSFTIKRDDHCESCRGTGARPGTSPTTCDYCGGQGQVFTARGFFQMATTCPACGGEGVRVIDPCPDCRGSGRQSKEATISPLKIPPGATNGLILLLRGQGEPGDPGAPRGNLRVQIQVRPHPFFVREDSNLICPVPVSFAQAALGAEIEVPTLDGPSLMEIPRGTQSGDVITLRGRGMPDLNGRGRGDQHVRVVIETPRKLTERQEELLRELAELDHAHVSPKRKGFVEKLRDFFTEPDDDHDSA